MEAAGDFVSKNTRIGWLPVITYILCIPVFIWCLGTSVYIYSMGTPKFQKKDMFATLKGTQLENMLFWAFLFCVFWVMAFIVSV
jgi:hypothetical protein